NGRGGEIRKVAVLKNPGFLAFVEIDAEKLALVLAEISMAAGQGNGSRYVSPGFHFLNLLSSSQANHVQQAIAATEDSLTTRGRGLAIDIIAGFVNPVRLS